MRKLSKEQILMLHSQLIEETGGSDAGIPCLALTIVEGKRNGNMVL